MSCKLKTIICKDKKLFFRLALVENRILSTVFVYRTAIIIHNDYVLFLISKVIMLLIKPAILAAMMTKVTLLCTKLFYSYFLRSNHFAKF